MINEIICGNSVEVMKTIEDNSIDMVMTSPPYDDIRDYNGFDLNLHNTGKEVYRILKPGGVAVMVMQDAVKQYAKSLTTFKTIIDWCDNIGFKLFDTIIYNRRGVWAWSHHFRLDHEYMPVFLKGERPLYFNKEPLKVPSKSAGKTFTGSTSFRKDGSRLDSKTVVTKPMKCRGTIWEYQVGWGEEGSKSKIKREHPATFPDMLPYDFIECFCPPGGIVLDPFVGSGTTCVAAISLDRNWIGIDISEEYCRIARERVENDVIIRKGESKTIFPFGL